MELPDVEQNQEEHQLPQLDQIEDVVEVEGGAQWVRMLVTILEGEVPLMLLRCQQHKLGYLQSMKVF